MAAFVKRILISRRTIAAESVMEYTVEKRDLFYEIRLFLQRILSFKKKNEATKFDFFISAPLLARDSTRARVKGQLFRSVEL